MILLFMGPSGSGKDTQAELIKDKLGFETISTGELLRAEVASGSDLGKEIKKTVDAGIWTPDDIVYSVLTNHIEKSTSNNFILTGVVRRESQIKLLDEALGKINKKLDWVIYFDLDENTAIERLSGRVVDPKTGDIYHERFNPAPEGVEVIVREDDKPEAILSRMKEFKNTADPIIKEYSDRNILKEIDASLDIDSINKAIINIIKSVNE